MGGRAPSTLRLQDLHCYFPLLSFPFCFSYFTRGEGATLVFLSVLSCHIIYHDGVGGKERDGDSQGTGWLRRMGPPCIWRHLHFWGSGADGTFSMAFANFGLDSLPRPFASTSPPRGDRVTSGKLSSSSSRLPMYVNLGPRFCAAGAEVAPGGQNREHHCTAFLMNGFALRSFLEDDDDSLDVTPALLYIAALACCVAPSSLSRVLRVCFSSFFVACTSPPLPGDHETNLGSP